MKTEITQAAAKPIPATPGPVDPSFLEEVTRLRSEIEIVSEELAWAKDSPLPKDEAKERTTASLAAHASTFRLPVWHFAEPNPDGDVLREMFVVHGATQIVRTPAGPSDEISSMSLGSVSVNLTELMLGLFGDELLAKMHKQIDALDYAAGPRSKDRPAMIKKLKGTLRDLGMEEEALICHAEERGVFIPRRADADPKIVLGYTADGARHDPFGQPAGAFIASASGDPASLNL